MQMKIDCDSTLDDAVLPHMRFFERKGLLRKLRFYVLRNALMLLAMGWITGTAAENSLLGLSIGLEGSFLYLLFFLPNMKERFKKSAKKNMVETLGTDQPIPCSYELTEDRLIFREMGMELSFAWESVQEINESSETVDLFMLPLGTAIIPKRAFQADEELQQWKEYIRSHATGATWST